MQTTHGFCERGCAAIAAVGLGVAAAAAGALTVDDFRFDGPLGSDGATIERVDRNHFKISLGSAPNQPTWCNMLYFQIARNARGNTLRLEITDPESPHPVAIRWGHWIGNQHPGEHNAQWRMAGMVDWLLSDAGADVRRRTVCHFILMSSPDGPSKGWYRVNGQGVDMNRSYFPEGADPERQAHEACIVQKDLERLMASPAPPATVWSMHTWAGAVEPILRPGPEMGTILGPWEDLRDIMVRNDPGGLIKPLKTASKPGSGAHWNNGPHQQFGVSSFLCEGSGEWTSKQQSLDAGAILMKSLAKYYAGTRPRCAE